MKEAKLTSRDLIEKRVSRSNENLLSMHKTRDHEQQFSITIFRKSKWIKKTTASRLFKFFKPRLLWPQFYLRPYKNRAHNTFPSANIEVKRCPSGIS